MRVDWGVFCYAVDRDPANYLVLHDIFQVIQLEALPYELDCWCAMGFRGNPGEKVDFRFRFITPDGERTPSSPTAKGGRITFGEFGFYEFSTEFRRVPIDAYGRYSFGMQLGAAKEAIGSANFDVIRPVE